MSETVDYDSIVTETDFVDRYPGHEFLMKCPECDGTHSHVVKMVQIDGQDAGLAWGGRGDANVIYIEGECGHDWKILFGFHKGQTYVQVWTVEEDEMKRVCGKKRWYAYDRR